MIFYHSSGCRFCRIWKDIRIPFSALIAFNEFLEPSGKFIGSNKMNRYLRAIEQFRKRKRRGRLMLDSGAFSAFNRGFKINLKMYSDFINQYGHLFDSIIALDVVDDWQASLANYKSMSANYDKIIPVWHFKEPFRLFNRYCALANHVAIGGLILLKKRSGNAVIKSMVLDQLRRSLYTTDGDKKFPECRFHGFALTSPLYLKSYNWHSVDSTLAVTSASWGGVILNLRRAKDIVPIKILVSNSTKKSGHHINNADNLISEVFYKRLYRYRIDPMEFDDNTVGWRHAFLTRVRFSVYDIYYQIERAEKFRGFIDSRVI